MNHDHDIICAIDKRFDRSSMTSHSRNVTTKKSKYMIPQDVRIQNVVRFWKDELSRQLQHDLRLTLGLLKAMVAKAYELDKEDGDSGLYHAALLAEERIYDLHEKLGGMIGQSFDDVVAALDKEMEKVFNQERS